MLYGEDLHNLCSLPNVAFVLSCVRTQLYIPKASFAAPCRTDQVASKKDWMRNPVGSQEARKCRSRAHDEGVCEGRSKAPMRDHSQVAEASTKDGWNRIKSDIRNERKRASEAREGHVDKEQYGSSKRWNRDDNELRARTEDKGSALGSFFQKNAAQRTSGGLTSPLSSGMDKACVGTMSKYIRNIYVICI